MKRGILICLAVLMMLSMGTAAFAAPFRYQKLITYMAPEPLDPLAQAPMRFAYKQGNPIHLAYLPPATEFDYYIAIKEAIVDLCNKTGMKLTFLAPQRGDDISGQMGMIQDALTRQVDAIILSTHDEFAAAPLVKQAVDKGIIVVLVNTDIKKFPTPVHGAVGYKQRLGCYLNGQWIIQKFNGKPAKVGVIRGLPGYHDRERSGGYLDAFKGASNFEILAEVSGSWNLEGGNTAAMDMLQAHPDINVLVAANDYMAAGAAKACEALGRKDITIGGNEGNTQGLEEIAAGRMDVTNNTWPVKMGQIAWQMCVDGLFGKFAGGFVDDPQVITDKTNVLDALKHPELLYPKPSKKY
jgi:ribose transport system substrate-binding protein